MLKRVIFIFDGMYLVLRMRNCRHQVQVGIRPDFLEEESVVVFLAGSFYTLFQTGGNLAKHGLI